MEKKLFRILSLDGGGIRGIIPATILSAIEEKAKKPISELFDLVAGTSTGGIIASGLLIPDAENANQPKYSAGNLLEFYTKEGARIFKKRLGLRVRGSNLVNETYLHDGLEQVLKEYFAQSELKDVLKPLVVTSYDIERRMPFYFKSRLAKSNPQSENFLLRDIARATSAAPTYFEPALLKNAKGDRLALVDGGVCANNPSIVAHSEAEELLRILRQNGNSAIHTKETDTREHGAKSITAEPNPERAADYFMVSIGTGNGLQPYPYDKTKGWGALTWATPVIDILMQGSAEVNHNHMQYILPDSPFGRHYIRINTMIDKDNSDMANAKPENIRALQAIADRLVRENEDRIEYVCKKLMA
ncbi:patatin-like phospholipase family protein [Haliscomenobacter hydrossis]|uniref:Patatin n=1 Tax=Haliscomenobacter hydrossis (strain ATCC 27775 / DSM 1100 / LMG 10767 / O) TaxID=760192 RepID=F4L1S4_HALH1|nr:patatin-like phospholipase family protein [Haliscomenobacter hydrossis]AEE49583.1 Patatin [Haliscomenobacter hydrossis DSM 1100]